MRTLLFTMKMTEEEHARFVRVAERWGLNIANLLRALVKREDTLFSRIGTPAQWKEAEKRIDRVARSLRSKRRKS